MIIINEDKWDDIKEVFLGSVDCDIKTEPLIRYDYKKNTQEEVGVRETYEFTKADTDYMLILDKEHKLIRSESEKDGKLKEHFARIPDEYTYKLSIKFRDKDGSWKDSSALENNF